MTNTKKQLMTAIAMLVVAALALGSSTYAWFVSNTSAKVEEMTFTAEAVDNLQIAIAKNWDGALSVTGTEPNEFKTLITAADIQALYTAAGAGNTITSAALKPASTTNGTSFYKIQTGDDVWTLDGGRSIANKFVTTNNISDNCVKAIPLYFKSTTNTGIKLDPSTVVTGAAACAARIEVVVDNSSVKWIWEPDATGHIADYQVSTKDGADGITKAISGEDTVGAMTTGLYKNTKPAEKICDLTANEPTLVTVYIWLEGCDFDCVSGLSAKDLKVNLQFSTVSNS